MDARVLVDVAMIVIFLFFLLGFAYFSHFDKELYQLIVYAIPICVIAFLLARFSNVMKSDKIFFFLIFCLVVAVIIYGIQLFFMIRRRGK